jgi:hypothetical protein
MERVEGRWVRVDDLLERLVQHPLYSQVTDEKALRIFMRSHVFCVWDFQSLLKALQRQLTCVDVPWLPTTDAESRRLINELVLDEESDVLPDGRHLSHFELYLEAMRDCGADTGPIEGFVLDLRRGKLLSAALSAPGLPNGVAPFVKFTMEIASSGDVHRIVGSFSYGREDLVPAMFQKLVNVLARNAPENWSRCLYYLNRHIESDGERHGPLAEKLLARVCGDDLGRWAEAEEAARASLEVRLELWDAISAEIASEKMVLDAESIG